MGNVNRYRRGPKNLVQVPVASATVIEKGDFVLLSGGKAVPPSVLLASGSESVSATAARDACADVFLGVAEESSPAGVAIDILVDVSLESIYELTQETAEAISFGDKVALMANSTASASYNCSDQEIDTVANGSTNPIAVCIKEHTSAQGTGTLCKILPQTIVNSHVGQD